MTPFETLEEHLHQATLGDARLAPVAETLGAIAAACRDIADVVARGPLWDFAELVCGMNADGDHHVSV